MMYEPRGSWKNLIRVACKDGGLVFGWIEGKIEHYNSFNIPYVLLDKHNLDRVGIESYYPVFPDGYERGEEWILESGMILTRIKAMLLHRFEMTSVMKVTFHG